jgi:hypothetical protein
MSFLRLRFLALSSLLALTTAAPAQNQQGPGLPLPRLDAVFPSGAKFGTSVEATVIGTDLEDAQTLLFTHPGIKAEEIKPEPPKTDPKDPKKDQKKQPPPARKGPQPAGKFKITVAPDVPPGNYDVRLVNHWGVSNPRVFCVGDLTEVTEKEPNNDVGEAQRIELNTTINGVISSPTDVDYSVFAGKKGQRVIFCCLASSIDSKARPMIEVYGANGRLIAANLNYNGNDALADAILQEDGDYFVRLFEFTYTVGSPQYFYRLSVSTAPWIDAVFPSIVEPGKPAQVTLYGRNLPGGVLDPGSLADTRPLEKLVVMINPPTEPMASQRLSIRSRITPPMSGADGFEYRIKGPNGISNPVLIAFASAKVVLEKEDNDRPEMAQEIPVPCEVAGRIDKRHDRDWYAFNAKKGDVRVVDLWSERMGVHTDLYFTVRKDKAATDMVEEDDNPDVLNQQQFYSRTSDPKPYRFVAAEDGRYLVGVGSRESNFAYGPRVGYRLRVTPEKPDFRLIIMPSSTYQPDSTTLHADGSQFLDVFVFRTDGFSGAITLTAEGLPPGVTCPPTVVSTGMKQGTLVLSAAANAPVFNGSFSVKGTATINGQPVVREARSATIIWATQPQQNLPTFARLDNALFLAVRDKAYFHVSLEADKAFVKKEDKLPRPLIMKQGDKLTVPFKVTRGIEPKTPITLQQISMGINFQQTPVTVNNGQPLPVIAADKNDGNLVVDVKTNAPPGVYTVVLKATTPIQFVKDPNTKKSQPVTVVGSTAPLVIKVLPLSVARVTATPKGNLKGGTSSEITVKVDRQFEYAGEFKVKLVFPVGTKGVSAAEGVIPAGKDEVAIPVSAAADVNAGVLQNVVVQVTATLEGTVQIPHEAKFNLTVEKAPPPPKKEEKKKDEKKEEKKKDKK